MYVRTYVIRYGNLFYVEMGPLCGYVIADFNVMEKLLSTDATSGRLNLAELPVVQYIKGGHGHHGIIQNFGAGTQI